MLTVRDVEEWRAFLLLCVAVGCVMVDAFDDANRPTRDMECSFCHKESQCCTQATAHAPFVDLLGDVVNRIDPKQRCQKRGNKTACNNIYLPR